MKRVYFPVLALFVVSACGNSSVEEPATETAAATIALDASDQPSALGEHTVKPQLPVSIEYKIIGTPIVGQPLGIDLRVTSALGPQQITLSYRVNDSTAMQFTEAQPARVSIAATNAEGPSLQQVRVIPLREGRLFLNVSATVEGENGSMSTVTAIPIQVGAAPPREILENGEVMLDENGELVRSLPASEE